MENKRKHSWEEQETSKGTKIALLILVVVIVTGLILAVTGVFKNDTKKDALTPEVLAVKYGLTSTLAGNWKTAVAEIETIKAKQAVLEKKYSKKPMARWPKKARAEYDLYIGKADSIKKQCDSLAVAYNFEMAALGWRFTTARGLPPDMKDSLPGPIKLFSPVPADTSLK